MRQMVLSMLVGAALAVPAAAEEPVSPPADLSRLDAMTAQYTMHFKAKSYTEAITSANEALAATEAALGPEHERVAQVLNDLGYLYEIQKDLVRAGPAHERALRIRGQVFDNDGPAVVQSLNHLADVYAAGGRHAQAHEAYTRSLAIMERNFPAGHPAFLGVLERYEVSLRADGQADTAEKVRARVFVIRANAQQP